MATSSSKERPRFSHAAAERSFDLIGATAGLVLLLPLLLAIAVAIKATSKGPVLVRQRRRGQDGTLSTIYAFRTRARSSSGSAAQVTPVGRFLWRHSLHQLPHLI